MCGRYVMTLPPDEIRRIFATTNPPPNVEPRWNVAPTQEAPVVRRHPETGQRHLDLLRWGLVPRWARDPKATRQPINARAETVGSSPMFRDAFRSRRCLVPADAFYEWQVTGPGKAPKQPLAVARADGRPMALAGLWEGWRGADGTVLRTFTIVTTTAADSIGHVHDRMAVILEPADWPAWLGEASGDPAALLRPSPAPLRIWPVSTAVNSVRNEGPDLLREVSPPSLAPLPA